MTATTTLRAALRNREVERPEQATGAHRPSARSESGDSDEVLRARLRALQLSEVLDETAPIHGFIFDLWRRDVPPERVSREVWKATGRTALHLITTGRSLLQTFRPAGSDQDEAMDQQADLEEMPEDKEGVLDNYDHPASASLTFDPRRQRHGTATTPLTDRRPERDSRLTCRCPRGIASEGLRTHPRSTGQPSAGSSL